MSLRVTKRLVFHIGGYDPILPAGDAYRRFLRELKRFERTWSVEASVSAPVIGPDEMRWTIITKGGNWRVENQFRLVRWDDVIQGKTQEPLWRRLPLGILAFFDFAFGGAFRGYLRINWHYAIFFLYHFTLVAFVFVTALAFRMLVVREVGLIGSIC